MVPLAVSMYPPQASEAQQHLYIVTCVSVSATTLTECPWGASSGRQFGGWNATTTTPDGKLTQYVHDLRKLL